jgi:hypothetical protein
MSPLLARACAAIDAIRINDIATETRNGRAVWVKRRRVGSGHVIRCANWFFRLARNPVSVCGALDEWQRWEIDCFQLLNGAQFTALAEGDRAVCADILPGQSLSAHLNGGTLNEKMLEAAGREFQRAHQLDCAALGGRWSHGDPHLANLLYDSEDDRVRFIDFEVIHDCSLTTTQRHADDLLVVLQDLVGRVAVDQWVPFAVAFLRAYGSAPVLAEVARRLVIPKGVPRLWWAIRTSYLAPRELRRRIDTLRRSLAGGGLL